MPTFIRKSVKKAITTSSSKHFVAKVDVNAPPRPRGRPKKQVDLQAITELNMPQGIVERNDSIHSQAESTIRSLDSLLTTPSKARILEEDVAAKQNAVYQEDDSGDFSAQDFNGISDLKEQEELYDEAIGYERKKKKAVEEQIKELEAEKEKERKVLEQEIKALKQELHRTAPLQNNKFFSLSKELREAITDIERLATQGGVQIVETPQRLSVAKEIPLSADAIAQVPFQAQPVMAAPPQPQLPPQPSVTVPVPVSPPPQEKKTLSKTKMMITGTTAAIIIIGASGVFANSVLSKPKLDQKIVDSYLQQNGQVKGAATTDQPASATDASATGEVDPSQADVPFEKSLWTDFNDPNFGITLQYPKNAVKAIRTDSNITFIRKTGYLFKIQRIETSLTVEEYWKQIKATSLNYTSAPDKFKNKPALKLSLEDMADYPGDRYLVKEQDFIYDIWYATPSNSFTKDDISRVEKMLASLSVMGVKK